MTLAKLKLCKIIESIGPLLNKNYEIKRRHIDLKLKESVLSDIEILMGPKTSYADRIIVESLLRDFPNAKIEDSYFRGKLRNKRD